MRALKVAMLALIGIGLCLRLVYYFLNSSLSIDEASLALNLMHRSYSGLFRQLDFNQAAPPGFLLLQKFAIDVFGPSPYALRLLPLLGGLAACLLLYPVASRFFGPAAGLMALALFAVSDPLVSFSSTSKQYSLDVATVLALYAVMIRIPLSVGRRPAIMLGLAGASAVWFSHPAAFVLAVIGVALLVQQIVLRRWLEVARLIAVIGFWLGSFTVTLALSWASIRQIQGSVAHALPSGRNGEPGVLQTLGGIIREVLGVPAFGHSVRAAITLVAIAFCAIGLAALRTRSSTDKVAVLLVPALLALVAALFGRYLIFPRAFLFTVPALVMLLANGSHRLISWPKSRTVAISAGASFVMLLGVTTFQTLRHLRSSDVTEPARALKYLVEHARPGDSLYVHRSAQYDFRYYLDCGCFANPAATRRARSLWPIRATADRAQFAAALISASPYVVAGTTMSEKESAYKGDFASLVGRRRVWILVIGADRNIKRALVTSVRKTGRRLDTFPRDDVNAVATVSLYSFHHKGKDGSGSER